MAIAGDQQLGFAINRKVKKNMSVGSFWIIWSFDRTWTKILCWRKSATKGSISIGVRPNFW
jgi:hypothetical protein